jgi:hypothetical protein
MVNYDAASIRYCSAVQFQEQEVGFEEPITSNFPDPDFRVVIPTCAKSAKSIPESYKKF